MDQRKWRFGGFELDRIDRELRLRGEIVELHARPLQLLFLLVENRDRFVSKDEIFDTLWPDTAVAESSLYEAMREVRKALGDDASQQRWIRTLRGRGFRFVGKVKEHSDTTTEDSETPVRQVGRWWTAGAVAATVAIAAIGGWAPWDRPEGARSPGPPSLVVLPFEDLSPNADHGYLARGMSEELIDRLAQVEGLEVKGRTTGQYASRMRWDIPKIGKETGATKVIEGSVRRSKDRLRITVQLVRAADGNHEWSRNYDRSFGDVLDLQEQIARDVAASLKLSLSASRRGTENVRAWETYQIAVGLGAKGGPQSTDAAIEMYRQAIELDPAYAAAYIGVAGAYLNQCGFGWTNCHQALPLARTATKRALELNDLHPGAHHVQAWLHSYDFEWIKAEKGFRRAIELNGGKPTGSVFAHLLIETGRVEEGIAQLDANLAQNPRNPFSIFLSGMSRVMLQRDVERAVELLSRAEMLESGNPLVPMVLWLGNRVLGQDERALEHLLAAPTVEDLAPELRGAYSSGGWDAVDASLVDFRIQYDWSCGSRGLGTYWRAQIGDTNGALDCLEEYDHEGRLGPWLYLTVSSAWDPLRKEPRFQALLEKMNLTEYAREM